MNREYEMHLYHTICRFVNPNEKEWEDFLQSFTVRNIERNSILLSEGDVTMKIAYIFQGCFRMYFSISGKEVCKDFQIEGQFTGSLYSLVTQNPAFFYIAAMEDSIILEISRERLNYLYDKYKVWERFGRLMLQQAFLYKEQREASFLRDPVRLRYRNFLKSYLPWAQRIPQKYIASYLGVTPETLSRIRAENLY